MNVGELKDLLDGIDDEVEVRLAHQPNWPFEYSISTVAQTELELKLEWNEEDQSWWVVDDRQDPQDAEYIVAGPCESLEAAARAKMEKEVDFTSVVYIAEGSQLGYLPGEARRAVSW